MPMSNDKYHWIGKPPKTFLQKYARYVLIVLIVLAVLLTILSMLK